MSWYFPSTDPWSTWKKRWRLSPAQRRSCSKASLCVTWRGARVPSAVARSTTNTSNSAGTSCRSEPTSCRTPGRAAIGRRREILHAPGRTRPHARAGCRARVVRLGRGRRRAVLGAAGQRLRQVDAADLVAALVLPVLDDVLPLLVARVALVRGEWRARGEVERLRVGRPRERVHVLVARRHGKRLAAADGDRVELGHRVVVVRVGRGPPGRSRSDRNATQRPSGDHCGPVSCPDCVSWTSAPLPARRRGRARGRRGTVRAASPAARWRRRPTRRLATSRRR